MRRFNHREIVVGTVISCYLSLVLYGLTVVIMALFNGEFNNASFGILG